MTSGASTAIGAAARVLVVEDEEPIRELVRGYLRRDHFDVIAAADGREALEIARRDRPDVVVLDLNLPRVDGLEVCRQLRTFTDAYVIMLTARGEETDRVVGLSMGADDYLVKPFSPRELVARVHALLRRPRGSGATPAGLHIDVERRRVRVDGSDVELTPIEFALLAALARRPGLVVTRDEMLATVWGSGYDDGHVIDVHVGKLRRKLGDDAARPRFIETVRGVGFRLAEE